jgi:small nuclear ribonucleoprotein (snRNP)-like protein
MDKYHGVFVRIVLSNNDTVKGHIYGKDENDNLILRNGNNKYISICNEFLTKTYF